MAYQIGDKYYHNDIEGGAQIEISKAVFDSMNNCLNIVFARMKSLKENKGTITVFSTPADDFNDGNEFKKLWVDINIDKHKKPIA